MGHRDPDPELRKGPRFNVQGSRVQGPSKIPGFMFKVQGSKSIQGPRFKVAGSKSVQGPSKVQGPRLEAQGSRFTHSPRFTARGQGGLGVRRGHCSSNGFGRRDGGAMGPGRRHVRSSGRRLGVPIAAAMGSDADNLAPRHHGLGFGERRQRRAPQSRMQAFALQFAGAAALRQIPRAAHSRSPLGRRHANRGAAPRSARVCGAPRGARSARVCGAPRGARGGGTVTGAACCRDSG
jgi:hypothetical protein